MRESTRSATPSTPVSPILQRHTKPAAIIAMIVFAIGLAMTVPTQSDWWQIILLGVVQGITEWLPISSTGHLLLTSKLIGYQGSIGGTFEIFIQIGTVLSVIIFYFSDLLKQAQGFIGVNSTPEETASARRFWIAVLIAMIPAMSIGLIFRDFIKTVLFDSPTTIAIALIVGGIILVAIEQIPHKAPSATSLEQMTFKQALGIGIAQCFALIPGVSRSGSTIVGGLLSGLDRATAASFSFYLAIPVLSAATLFDLIGSLDAIVPSDWGRLILGATTAMIVGWMCISWLLRYISRHSFVVFGVYRIIAGIVILGLVAIGWM